MMDKEDSLLGLKGSPMKFVLTKVWIRKNMYLNVGFAIGVLVLLLESSERKTVFGLLVGGGRAQHIVHGDIYI